MTTEILQGDRSLLDDAKRAVRERGQNKCANCGSADRTRVHFVVPLEASGKPVPSNGVLLCRACELAKASLPRETPEEEDRRPVNLWVSTSFYNRLQHGLKTRNGFRGMSPLVRFLIRRYIDDEGRFDDLEKYQDEGSNVKINVWVDRKVYATFKVLLDRRNVTVTDAVKSLILMYEAEAEPLMRLKSKQEKYV